jgi:zinc/manganese transport system ATP-binding protein
MGARLTVPDIHLARLGLRHGGHEAVKDLSGTFTAGSLTAVAGPNGAGKTTLLRALAGLHPIASGSIDRGGLDAGRIALLPQGSQLDRRFPITCAEVVALGAAARAGPFRAMRAAQPVAAALAQAGLKGAGNRLIGSLSAGQFQRVLFARLIVQDAPVILLDEPFTAIDATTTQHLLDLTLSWHQQGRTVIAVLHDLEMIRALFPETLLLAECRIAWGATPIALSPANCARAGLSGSHWARRQLPAA